MDNKYCFIAVKLILQFDNLHVPGGWPGSTGPVLRGSLAHIFSLNLFFSFLLLFLFLMLLLLLLLTELLPAAARATEMEVVFVEEKE